MPLAAESVTALAVSFSAESPMVSAAAASRCLLRSLMSSRRAWSLCRASWRASSLRPAAAPERFVPQMKSRVGVDVLHPKKPFVAVDAMERKYDRLEDDRMNFAVEIVVNCLVYLLQF